MKAVSETVDLTNIKPNGTLKDVCEDQQFRIMGLRNTLWTCILATDDLVRCVCEAGSISEFNLNEETSAGKRADWAVKMYD